MKYHILTVGSLHCIQRLGLRVIPWNWRRRLCDHNSSSCTSTWSADGLRQLYSLCMNDFLLRFQLRNASDVQRLYATAFMRRMMIATYGPSLISYPFIVSRLASIDNVQKLMSFLFCSLFVSFLFLTISVPKKVKKKTYDRKPGLSKIISCDCKTFSYVKQMSL